LTFYSEEGRRQDMTRFSVSGVVVSPSMLVILEPIAWTVIDINSVERVGMTLRLDIINPSSSCRIMIYGLTCCALLIT
jgi:hypothetical protein